MNSIRSVILLVVLAGGFFSKISYSQANDTITIYHKHYSTAFSKSKRFPVVVKYWLTKAMLDCEQRVKRTKRFKPDPSISEFTKMDNDNKKSGYDRGHQMDAFDCDCDSTEGQRAFTIQIMYFYPWNTKGTQ